MKKIFFCSLQILLSFSSFSQEKQHEISVYFEFDSDMLTRESELEFRTLLKKLKKERCFVSVTTSCDTVGSTAYNKDLSERRLVSVCQRLLESKVEFVDKQSAGEMDAVLAKGISNAKQRKAIIRYAAVKEEDMVAVTNSENDGEKSRLDRFVKALPIQGEDKSEAIVLDIQFVGGQAVFLGDSYLEVEDLFDFLSRNPRVKAFIRGHVCCQNDPPLATERAYVVYQELLKKGIAPKRLDFKGYSNTIPVVNSELTEQDRQRNRRVDVIFSLE
jgi:outer membrane protein OmpA-like peptidoglycan-associated protein